MKRLKRNCKLVTISGRKHLVTLGQCIIRYTALVGMRSSKCCSYLRVRIFRAVVWINPML